MPSILEGIPLDLRSVVLNLDRGQFIAQPDHLRLDADHRDSLTALSGQSVPLKAHFQVGECGRLGFKPKLSPEPQGLHQARRAARR